MTGLRITFLLACAGLALPGGPAAAADLDLPPLYEQAPEMVPVEVGNGWYLRGDVSYDFKSDLDVRDRTYDLTSPHGVSPATYAYGHEAFEIDSGAAFGVGAGYQFSDVLRGDLTAHYWSHDVSGSSHSTANCDAAVFAAGTGCRSESSTKLTTWELMANAYLDLGNIMGLTPYVGAGVGAVHLNYDTLSRTSYCVQGGADCGIAFNGAVDHGGLDTWRFAYALMAGASYDLTRSLKLDVGYRYVDVDEGDMYGFDATTRALGAAGTAGSDKGFDRHTIQAGLRYSLF